MPIKTIIIVAAALLAVGCIPIPHSERLAPKATGTVVDAHKKPLPGVRVEYLFRGGRVLGETVTSGDGRFTLGPFSQWFYMAYIGSPGVAPFPYRLERAPELPDVVRISANGATGIYLRGTQAQYDVDSRPQFDGDGRKYLKLPPRPRWTAGDMILTLTPDMKDSNLPSVDRPAPSIPELRSPYQGEQAGAPNP
jgi:hypothetical protein